MPSGDPYGAPFKEGLDRKRNAMAGNPSTSFWSPLPPPAASDRLYAAALGGCLLFLIATTWLQSPITGYQAGALVALSDARGDSRRVAEYLREPKQQADVEHWLETEHVRARWLWEGNPTPRLELTLVGKTEPEAIANLDAVARRFMSEFFQARQQAAQEKLLAEQRARLADARLQEEVLERNVSEALADLQAATSEAEASWREAFEARAKRVLAALAAKRRLPPPPTPNPEWEELTASLLRRETEASRLLLKFTKNHPLLVDLQSQLVALRDELSRTPRYLKNDLRDKNDTEPRTDNAADQLRNLWSNRPTEFAEPDLDESASGGADTVPQPPRLRLGSLSDHLENLRSELGAAREARGQAEMALVETLGTPADPGIRVSLIEPAQLQEVHGGKSTKQGLAAALVASVLAAGGIWIAFRGLSPERLETKTQLERRLALPLLCSVRSAAAPDLPPLTGERCIWWFLRGCEGTLVLLVALAAITLIADSQLSKMFVTDPLRAAGEVVTRWR